MTAVAVPGDGVPGFEEWLTVRAGDRFPALAAAVAGDPGWPSSGLLADQVLRLVDVDAPHAATEQLLRARVEWVMAGTHDELRERWS